MRIIEEFGHIKPTVRTILYQLDGMGLLDKSRKTDSNALSDHLVDARKVGLIEWDALSDDARTVLGKVSDFFTVEEWIDDDIDKLRDSITDFY